jgi:hypothetical protein
MTTPYEVVLQVPATAHEIAALQAAASGELEAWKGFTIDTPEEYAEVDRCLTDVVRRKDAATAMRGSATGPLYKATKTIEGWFAPYLGALTGLEVLLKGGMASYRLAQAEREREAREAAAAAADAGDGAALTEALTVATEAAQAPAGRASVGFEWRVHRIVPDLLPREWWTPDEKRIAAFAKAHKGDDPPVIPGVVFERHAKIGARR